jgi:translocation and assembly module TamB
MRRALQVAMWIVLVPLALAILLLAALAALNTDPGLRFAERLVYRLSDGMVTVSGLSGRLPHNVHVSRLQMQDRDGVWLQAEEATLRWSLRSLLGPRIHVQVLRAARLDVQRRPQPSEPDAAGEPSSLSRRVEVAQLEVERLDLGAALAGRPVALTVRAHGGFRSIDDAMVELQADRIDGGEHYRLSYQADAERIDATVDLEEPANGTLANLLRLPELGALRMRVSLGGPRNAERLAAELTAGELNASARGTLDWQRGSADLEFAAQSPEMAPRSDLRWSGLALTGRWRGTLDAPMATIALRISELRAAGGGSELLEVDVTGADSRIQATVMARGVRLPGEQPQLLAASPLRLTAAMDMDARPRHVTFTVTHALMQAEGTATVAERTQLTAALRLPALAPLSDLIGARLVGEANLRVRFNGNAREGAVAGEGTLRVSAGDDPWPALIGRDARLLLKLDWAGARVRFEEMRLAAAAAEVHMSGERSIGGAWNVRWGGAISELAVLADNLAGELTADGRLQGTTEDLRTEANLRANVSVSGSTRAPIEARLSAERLLTDPVARIQVGGRFDDAPLELTATVARDRTGTLHLALPTGSWKSARATGELTWPADTSSAVPQGRLTLSIPRLEDLQRFTGQSVPGSIRATLEAGGADRQLRLQLVAKNVQYRAYTANAQVEASGTTAALALKMDMGVRGTPGGDLQLAGEGRLRPEERRLDLAALRLEYREHTVTLLEPAGLQYGEKLALQGVRVGFEGAELRLDGRLQPTLDIEAELQGLMPGALAAVLPDEDSARLLPAQGTVALQASLTGTLAAPRGNVALQARNLQWQRGIAEGLPAISVTATAALQAEQAANLRVQLQAGTDTELTISGQMPFASGAAIPLALSVTGKANLNLANGVLEAGGRRASGQLDVSGMVRGTSAKPELSGTLRLRNGELQDFRQGLRLTAVNATMEADGELLRITSFRGTAGGGTIEAAGSIGVVQPGIPVDLKLTARGAQPISSDLLTATVDADLGLTGRLSERLDLAGRVTVRRAEITIPNALPPDIAMLDVRRPDQRAPAPARVTRTLAFDVDVDAPRAVFVRGRGLDAELGGQLHWGGTQAAPQISGGFELREGRFNLVGKTLEFQSGRVSFNGRGVSSQFDPLLDFVASNNSAGVTTTLKLSGFANAPVLTLESSPQLPQDEVLARLLFGASVTQLTALQVAQMGAAVATLGGVGRGGAGPLLSLQRSLGLDRLAIGGTGTESGGATIEAGRYVSRRVYVGTKQSTSGATRAEVEVDISRQFKMHASVGTGAVSAQGASAEEQPSETIGLSYEFEY